MVECNEHVDLRETLFSGQVFHFKEVRENEYMGVLGGTLVFLRQETGCIRYLDSHPESKSIVENFFNTHVDAGLQNKKHGLRFLTNDFYPTVFSFICSSNNNIKRITKMVEYLYSYGTRIDSQHHTDMSPSRDTRGDEPGNATEPGASLVDHVFYTFPELNVLVNIEDDLRKNKFGYRAEYICDAARFLLQNRIEWHALSYEEARATLMKIKGVGRKVADCICLISLKQFHVVPIDTHILKYSSCLFSLELRGLNAKTYDMIQKMWVEKFGRYAGIAQLYAFKEYVDRNTSKPKIISKAFS